MESDFKKNLRLSSITGVGVGSLLMYYLDPHSGVKRRSRLLQQSAHQAHHIQNLILKASRDLVNRGQGIVAEGKKRVVSNPRDSIHDVLIARVRSKVGRYSSHPHAIEVREDHGEVTLRGQILSDEARPLVLSIRKIPGVKEVVSHLELHKPEEKTPSLQGGLPPKGERPNFLHSSWAPGTRVLFGSMGVIACQGLGKKGWIGKGLGAIGLAAVIRSITNLEFRELLGVGRKGHPIRIQKLLNIDAPVERVYEIWSNFENFPKFMTRVKNVRISRGTQSHWTILGPAGAPLSWDAILTQRVANQVLAWKSLPGSVIHNSGLVRFRKNEQGGTRINLDLSYHPPMGALGHFTAHLFGADPKNELDESLAQMKTFLEQGPSERQLRKLAF